MPCPTARRWFVPDEEYYLVSEDYTVVDKCAYIIQTLTYRFTTANDDPTTEYDNYNDYMRYHPRWFLEITHGNAALVYADVNRANPEHKATVHDINTQKPWLETEEKETEEAGKGPIKFVRDNLFHESDDATVDVYKYNDEEAMAETMSFIRHVGVPDQLINYIISLKDANAKLETLRILSGQKLHRKPRPVMILINMLGNMDQDGGWCIGYDFVRNLLIIKSFNIKEDQHPLDKSWFKKPPRDDLYYSASPHDFTKALVLELSSDRTGDREGFNLVVSYLAGKWIRSCKNELEISEELCADLQKALDAMKTELKEEQFPKMGNESEIPERVKINVVQRDWVVQRHGLLEDEDVSRDLAIRAKEDGFDISANNLAKYFERTVKELEAFAKDPEVPLEI